MRRFLLHENPEFQEEAFHVVRNLADNEAGIEMVYEGLGASTLLNALSQGLESDSDGVMRQVRTPSTLTPAATHMFAGNIRTR